ncbi:GmrSD restriction endonuclease domain-containing protein [Pseudoalteromonas denitrificans]|uniref:Uncharacterized protein n=1 Tax=Pseudoalteromonas denitrificans DSM 6059 TaxID=1123010 RepID=A0A1I1TSK6_9GAMM|nr:DUF262 domain-containing protein [Pseudoalteromonas denitrificans]SFD61587.1 Protein of unknown function DUF262 [Pseudoalteromonas denitrificans DSM 6059]
MGKHVNLDAMFGREDFACEDNGLTSYDKIDKISVRSLKSFARVLKKPDFQRETNHWTPHQVAYLLECYVTGDLIPSVILWQSNSNIFVIDGGHRLSALRAWVEDDYGDRHLSQKMFGNEISRDQIEAAEKTRKLVEEKIGSWEDFEKLAELEDNELTDKQKSMHHIVESRGLSIQWVSGDEEKAQASFFNINMKGTPLDDLEELLLRHRKRPVAIAARAIIRAGKGHRYWSRFDNEKGKKIEEIAKRLHTLLFDPEVKSPVKTLDLPLGGAKGLRTAIKVLIEFILISIKNQKNMCPEIKDHDEDLDGQATIDVLLKAEKLASRITGNIKGSLGLHPAIYYYGPSGKHSSPMFLGTMSLIASKLAVNDKDYFKKFTEVRLGLESTLVEHKTLLATLIQKPMSSKRVQHYQDILKEIIDALLANQQVTENKLIELSGMTGKVFEGTHKTTSSKISADIKSRVFIHTALKSAIKCPQCDGFIDTEKSVSYDHKNPVRNGGSSYSGNIQLMHPYCNQSIKC